jgi:hypothetical protein
MEIELKPHYCCIAMSVPNFLPFFIVRESLRINSLAFFEDLIRGSAGRKRNCTKIINIIIKER